MQNVEKAFGSAQFASMKCKTAAKTKQNINENWQNEPPNTRAESGGSSDETE